MLGAYGSDPFLNLHLYAQADSFPVRGTSKVTTPLVANVAATSALTSAVVSVPAAAPGVGAPQLKIPVAKRIPGGDFRSWDKLDYDALIESADSEPAPRQVTEAELAVETAAEEHKTKSLKAHLALQEKEKVGWLFCVHLLNICILVHDF